MQQQIKKKYSQQPIIYINFFIAMALGAAAGYYGLGLSVVLYLLLKLMPKITQIQCAKPLTGKDLQTLRVYIKMIEGVILGSLTGLVWLPLTMAILVKQLDDKLLQINKNILPIQKQPSPFATLLPCIVIGILIGKVVIFVDILLLKAILIMFSYFLFVPIFQVHYDKYQQSRADHQGKSSISQNEYNNTSIIQNILIGYYLCAYSSFGGYFNSWICLGYIGWFFVSIRVYQKFGFKFLYLKQEKNEQQKFSEIFQCLSCPISSEVMTNPYSVKQCGHTFDKQQLNQSIRLRGTCPLCNTKSVVQNIMPNIKVKQIIDQIRKQL